MWPFSKKSVGKPRSLNYYKKRLPELWDSLVLPTYEGDTLQGDMLRCVVSLERECNRNAFANWHEGDVDSLAMLREHLLDSQVFDAATLQKINDCLDVVGKDGPDLQAPLPCVETLYLLHRVVDWCDAHPDEVRLREERPYYGHEESNEQ